MVIRQWEVLDTRGNPATVYNVEVATRGRKFVIQQRQRLQVPTNRIIHLVPDSKEVIDPVKYEDRELCESMALAYVLGLEEHGCMVVEEQLKS